MEIKEKQDSVARTGFMFGTEYYPNTYIIHSSSNCKLTTVEGIGYLTIYSKTEEEKLEKVKAVLKKSRILTLFHTSQEKIKDFFVRNFEIYDISKIPVGYNGGYQWHIFVRNTEIGNSTNRRPVEKNEKLPMDNIEKTLKTALINKGKKRKADIIKEVIANLNIK